MGKSKNNSKHATSLPEVAQGEHPTVQADSYTLVGYLSVLILIDCWTKNVMAEQLRNKNQGVVGQVVARFLATMGYFQTVELAVDNEPVLAAGMKMAPNIRANHGLETIIQPGLMYSKSRTSLAERTIQTVRGQGKTFSAYVEYKVAAKLPERHPLHAWAMIHASWILNRFHVSYVTGVTSHMALRGRPYNGKIYNFACEVYALDPPQTRYQSQWRRGVWLTKDEVYHNVVCIGSHELVRSKAVRKTDERWDLELILAMQVGPWDMKHMKRGIHTQVQPEFPLPQPVPRVVVLPGQVEPELDVDAADVIKYAKENPLEDLDEGEQFDAA